MFSEGGGVPESPEGGRQEEAGERAAAHPGGAGEAAEEEGTRDPCPDPSEISQRSVWGKGGS